VGAFRVCGPHAWRARVLLDGRRGSAEWSASSSFLASPLSFFFLQVETATNLIVSCLVHPTTSDHSPLSRGDNSVVFFANGTFKHDQGVPLDSTYGHFMRLALWAIPLPRLPLGETYEDI
jgi:hypothetical protein